MPPSRCSAPTSVTASSGTLDYTPATAWDHSNPREYHTLTGGDMFRLVPAHHFTHLLVQLLI